MSEAREFLKQYEDVAGMEIYGFTDFIYAYINDRYKSQISYDPSLIRTVFIDIEVSSAGGFPDIATADKPITAITISWRGRKHVFGLRDFKPHKDNVIYYHCKDEETLLAKFLTYWQEISPDCVTGWNVEFFDIPYIINRIKAVFDDAQAARLSPWFLLREYEVEIRGKMNKAYTPVGINVLDYINLYKKFTYSQQESYTLNHISYVELGEKKVDYSQYGSLNDLYEKNHQLFIEYNVKDVELVERLEDKMKLIELVFAMAYDAKVNFEDTLGSVKQWDVIIHNYLLSQNIVVPQFKKKPNSEIVGGYVKEPVIGMSKWVVSMDFKSLYPHLIMTYNISPETLAGKVDRFYSVDELLQKQFEHDGQYSYCANGTYYSKDKQGFLPYLMQKMYNDRAEAQKQLKQIKKQYNDTKDESLLKQISALNNKQMAKKIQLNSAYGALANMYFRWFNADIAEAITLSGQLAIRWVETNVNRYLNGMFKTKKDYVIAVDTDSNYITLEKLVEQYQSFSKTDDVKKIVDVIDKFVESKLKPFIDSACQDLHEYMNSYEQKLVMNREAIADKGIWKAKKMYILNVLDQEGVRYDSPKLKMMGIEAIKSSTPTSCRQNLKKAFEIVMNQTEGQLQQFVADFKSQFSSLPFEEVAFPRGVKDIEKWEGKNGNYLSGTPIHVKASMAFNAIVDDLGLQNKYEKIVSGSKIKFCYMRTPNRYNIQVLGCPSTMPDEFKMQKHINYDMQFDKGFIEPLRSITETIGWNIEKLSTLEDFWN
jgi:DNA polymerase elongation subunit (family B)